MQEMTQSARTLLDSEFNPTKTDPIYIRKKSKFKNLEENEIYWLNKLLDRDWSPNIINTSDGIIMTYVGEKITSKTLPADWHDQMERILGEMETIGCCHNDIKQEEILVSNGKLRLIDFQHMTATREEYKAKKKSGECRCRMSWTDREALTKILTKLEDENNKLA